MPDLFGKAVSVSGGTGARIAESPGGDHHPAGEQRRPIFTDYTLYPPFVKQQALRLLLVEDRTGARHRPAEGSDDVARPVAHREDPVAPRGLERHSELLEKRHRIGGGEAVDGAVLEPWVAAHRPEEGVVVAVVGDI